MKIKISALTGKPLDWRWWDDDGLILEAASDSQDSYDHPAICAKDMAYCGFVLEESS